MTGVYGPVTEDHRIQSTPDLGSEGYCCYCRKMVPLLVGLMIQHYTFRMNSLVNDNTPEPCNGRMPDNTITHYMDDSKAAFE